MEEDEEVILKDSALYSHLHTVGFTEFEVSTSHNSMIGLEKNIENIKFGRKNEKSSLIVKFFLWLMSLLKLTELKNELLRQFAVKLIKSKVLVEKDLLTLENFSSSVEYLITNPELMNFEEAQTKFSFHRREYYIFILSFAFGIFSNLVADFGLFINIIFVCFSFGYLFYR